jgi:hypothetical protein
MMRIRPDPDPQHGKILDSVTKGAECAEYGTISGRRMTCLSEAARGSSQGHPYLRQVQTEKKAAFCVVLHQELYLVPGTVPTYGDGCIFCT